MLCESDDVDVIYGSDVGDVDPLITVVTSILEGGAGIGRPISDLTPVTLEVDAQGRTRIALPDWPLAAITKIDETIAGTTTTLDAANYHPDLNTGIITRLNDDGHRTAWTRDTLGVEVTYTRAIPPDLRWLCARIVSRVHRTQSLQTLLAAQYPELQGLTQLTVSRWSATVAAETIDPASALDLNEFDLMVVDSYRDRLP